MKPELCEHAKGRLAYYDEYEVWCNLTDHRCELESGDECDMYEEAEDVAT